VASLQAEEIRIGDIEDLSAEGLWVDFCLDKFR
jgi:hypothetical protein